MQGLAVVVDNIVIVTVAFVLLVAVVTALVLRRGRTKAAPEPRPGVDYSPGVGDDAAPVKIGRAHV